MRTYLLTGFACFAAASGFAQSTRHPATSVIMQKEGSYLGIGVQDVDSDRAKALKLKEERGAEITSVEPDSPASKAGIKAGDVVLEYNGTAVQGMTQLQRLVSETPPGRPVKLMVWRNAAEQTLTATPGQRKGVSVWTPDGDFSVAIPSMPPMPPMPAVAPMPRMIAIMPSVRLGIEGEALNEEPQFAEFMGVKDGVLVKAVSPNSAAEKAGIKAGDVIVKVEDTSVSSSSDITRSLRASRSKRTVNLTVVRTRKEMPVTVTLDER